MYGKGFGKLRSKRCGEEYEARSMAMYLCRTVGGHTHSNIGRELGLATTSAVRAACLRMRARAGVERRRARKARKIEEELNKGQERT